MKNTEARGQFPLALLRSVLCRAESKPYMCRLRIPNGILKAAQFAGIADSPSVMAGATRM